MNYFCYGAGGINPFLTQSSQGHMVTRYGSPVNPDPQPPQETLTPHPDDANSFLPSLQPHRDSMVTGQGGYPLFLTHMGQRG